MKLKFGTGGLRAVMGNDETQMNVPAIQQATLGVAAYIKTFQKDAPKAAIAYDTRNHSEEFARETARVFAAQGVRVFIYPQPMPTPMLSFAVRKLQCDIGVCITASHNPREYNGYKVYGADGCQITKQAADMIQKEIIKADMSCMGEAEDFAPTAIDRYTVVMWLEGSDTDCTDNILGGEIKIHMDFNSEITEPGVKQEEE